ncbi:hypothetical protein A1O1_05881 [Capronia coronata CBS 617.96]|uniref:Uncharacterized protein n=1 Tax=Capronia coronata CBS 617.96 TaxID=1182541 RepID=W9XYA5_9EURO|nr:uncharacterized protein A1O1_05881 [Capronia coronata CBS 617.96]EXJ85517.1 hypothetical protein A1O1_05881 [Capronia coronata CBS 617.96]
MPRVNTKDTVLTRPVPAPWTTSRCNRTLRQLTSFVHRLEKWHKAYLAAQEEDETEDGVPGSREKEPAGETQPDWLARNNGEKKQRLKRTYMMRGKHPESLKPALQSSSASRSTTKTPKKRTIPAFPAESGVEILPARKASRTTCPRRRSKEPVPGRVGDYETTGNDTRAPKWTPRTIHLAAEYERIIATTTSTVTTFLVATSDHARPAEWPEVEKEVTVERAERGARSLLDTCLHKLSKDMVEQQRQCDAHNDGFNGQFDAIGSQLEDLEDYFGDPKVGWPQLRSVTRACGVHMLANLVETGTLPEGVALDLVLRSYDNPVFSDIGPAILQALVNMHLHSCEPGARYHDLPLYIEASAQRSGLEQVRQRMSIDWTLLALQRSHDSVAIVSRSIRLAHLMRLAMQWKVCHVCHLSPKDPSELLEAIYIGALSLGQPVPDLYSKIRKQNVVATVVPDVAREPNEHHPLSEHVWNRLHMGFTLLLTTAHGQGMVEGVDLKIERISKRAQILYELDQNFAMTEYQLYLVALFFFCNICLLMLNGRRPPENLLDSFESLLYSMESCAREAWRPLSAHFVLALLAQNLGLEEFQSLVQRLLLLDCGGCKTLEVLLAVVSADAAMDYAAEHHDDDAILKWASNVHKKSQAKMEKRVTEPRTPASKQMKVGYRWDEAIEEWIARTPATLAKLKKKDIETTTADAICTIAEDHCAENLKASTEGHRRALELIASDEKSVPGKRMKRKSAPSDLEVHWDGDFEYKKRPRRHVSFSTFANPPKHGPRHSHTTEEESEDELSLLV